MENNQLVLLYFVDVHKTDPFRFRTLTKTYVDDFYKLKVENDIVYKRLNIA